MIKKTILLSLMQMFLLSSCIRDNAVLSCGETSFVSSFGKEAALPPTEPVLSDFEVFLYHGIREADYQGNEGETEHIYRYDLKNIL